MAEYKKKKVKRTKKAIKNSFVEEIPMKPSTKKSPKKEVKETASQPKKKAKPTSVRQKQIKVISGNKLMLKKRNKKIAAIVALLITAVVLISIILPTGILDAFRNSVALIGKGLGYDVKLSGTSLSNVVDLGDSYIAVTPTDIVGFNHSGKTIFSYLHGYDIPIIEASSSRFLVYGQGEKNYTVYNLADALFEGEASNEILAADIARNGTFAIASLSDSYTSQVTVYDKNNENIYTWFCADYIINNVLLDNDGNTLVLSAFNAQNGEYVSKLYVIKFDSATPIRVFDYKDIILSLSSENSSSFGAVFESGIEYFSWRNFANTSNGFENNISFFESTNQHSIAVTSRNANKGDNTISVYNYRGVEKHKFNFSSEIIDISMRGRYIYILSSNKVSVYNYKGVCVKTYDIAQGANFVIPIGNMKCAVCSDTHIKLSRDK